MFMKNIQYLYSKHWMIDKVQELSDSMG